MTHIAGLGITIQGRYMRQRCAWCGLVLLDYDLAEIASIDGSPPRFWEVSKQVEVDGNMSALVAGDDLPADACSLMEIGR